MARTVQMDHTVPTIRTVPKIHPVPRTHMDPTVRHMGAVRAVEHFALDFDDFLVPVGVFSSRRRILSLFAVINRLRAYGQTSATSRILTLSVTFHL